VLDFAPREVSADAGEERSRHARGSVRVEPKVKKAA